MAGWLQWFLPRIAAKIRNVGNLAYQQARWHQYQPKLYGNFNFTTAGYRTTEYLDYTYHQSSTSDGLNLHQDTESLYTVLVMLSDPKDYEGGELLSSIYRKPIVGSGEQKVPWSQHQFDIAVGDWTLKLPQYSALVFLAEENFHKVMPVMSAGQRHTFANEFWSLGDAPIGIMRPSPAMFRQFLQTGQFPFDSWRNYEAEKEKV